MGGGRVKAGCRQGLDELNTGPKSRTQHGTLQASSRPSSKNSEISPEPLRQITVINNKSPHHNTYTPPRGKTNRQDPVALATEPWPARPAAARLFPTLFVYLFTQRHQRQQQQGRLSSQSLDWEELEKNGEPLITCNFVGLEYLIRKDKLDSEWALMTDWPTGNLGVLCSFVFLL